MRRKEPVLMRRVWVLVPLIAAVVTVMLVAGLVVWSAPGQAAETTSTDLTLASPTEIGMGEPADAGDTLGARRGETPLMKASGPVPAGIAVAAATGDPFYQLAKYVWESGGDVIPTGDGEYIIPMPDRIPPDFVYPPEKIPAAEVPLDTLGNIDDLVMPPYLDPSEYELFAKSLAEGVAFVLEQGSDGYRHVVR